MTGQLYGKHYGGNVAENYERFFVPHIGTPVARTLIEYAAPAPGEQVLDVACGTGVVTRAAAERVGDQGRVTGLDITGAMIAVAKAVPAAAGIDWREADAEAIPFDNASFDLVLCQMGLQFMSNKLAALRQMRRVLKPGGRLALNLPGPTPGPFVHLAAALAEHVGPEAANFCHLVFSLHDADELRELAAAAGFDEIDVRSESVGLDVPAAAEFLWGYLYSTPLAQRLNGQVGDAKRAALQQNVCTAWDAFARDDGMHFEVGITTLRCR